MVPASNIFLLKQNNLNLFKEEIFWENLSI